MSFPTKIDCINANTVVSDADIKKVVDALQIQVTRDFAPLWYGAGADLFFVPKGGTPDPTHWQLVFLDNSDVANALGYHDITRYGKPLGKVFVKTNIEDKTQWSVAASHELLEMLGDPDINMAAQNPHDGRFWAYENCDAVEADNLGYLIDGVQVSDFVLPEWFEPSTRHLVKNFDFKGHTTKPFQILYGGYMIVYDQNQGWVQVYNKDTEKKCSMRGAVGSRRERRRIQREEWVESTA